MSQSKATLKTRVCTLLSKNGQTAFCDIVDELKSDYAKTRQCVKELVECGEVEPIGLDSYTVEMHLDQLGGI